MKTVRIIAIISLCIAAVLGSLFGLQQIISRQAQIALEEYTKSHESETVVHEVKQPSDSLQVCLETDNCISEKIIKIVDGDTIYTENNKIRLSLTNTPEKGESGFDEATSFTASLCPEGSTITVNQDDLQPYDKYGRLLGKVFCGDKLLNSELLYNGHANILKSYCDTSEFSKEDWAVEFGCQISDP